MRGAKLWLSQVTLIIELFSFLLNVGVMLLLRIFTSSSTIDEIEVELAEVLGTVNLQYNPWNVVQLNSNMMFCDIVINSRRVNVWQITETMSIFNEWVQNILTSYLYMKISQDGCRDSSQMVINTLLYFFPDFFEIYFQNFLFSLHFRAFFLLFTDFFKLSFWPSFQISF